MAIHPEAVVDLLDRIDRHARLDILCREFDSGAAKAFRRDIRSIAWLLQSCPDAEIRDALVELRKRYLVVPSEFQHLIDQAIGKTEHLVAEAAS